ncbi:MAG: HhH-GPD-type base excision DNA repair protein [Jiangellaceae bacterium]
MDATPSLRLAQDERADALLSRDPFALLLGMLLDQQIPMEWAFTGPWTIAERLGTPSLDPRVVAAQDPDAFAAVMSGPPAVHRYPASMGARVQKLAEFVVEHYDGDASRLWTDAGSGAELKGRLAQLPGFGDQKARIFVALLGKQLGVQPDGWREAAGTYGDDGSRRSVADVVDGESLAEVRAYKKQVKAAAKAAKP